METVPRHQCLIYEGSPSRQLPALAALVRQKLEENVRCLYLNSPVMVAGIRCYLAAAGIDVAYELEKTSLDQAHLIKGRFNVDRMVQTLEDALWRALDDGFQGLWATGDMTWELGPENNFSKLLEYEWRLEEFFRTHPALSGICQYHADTLPRDVLRQGLITHPSLFLNETLSRINPHYLRAGSNREQSAANSELESMIDRLCHYENPDLTTDSQ